jgi:hypothetical protein
MMQKETWQYEALRALGDGQWLSDNPTHGLSELGAHMVKQMVGTTYFLALLYTHTTDRDKPSHGK